MNKKFIYGAVTLTFIVAVIALVISIGDVKTVKAGAASLASSPTTNLPSLGVGSLVVGSGCTSSFGTCSGTSVDPNGNFIQGGQLATTTGASMTLAATDLDHSTIEMFPSVGSITVTLPATTTSGMSSYLPNAGDTSDIMFVNSTSTAGINITFAAGTGSLLQTASSTSKLVQPGGAVLLRSVRKSNGDIVFVLYPTI